MMHAQIPTHYPSSANPHQCVEDQLDVAHDESMGFCCVERLGFLTGSQLRVTVADALDTLCEAYKGRTRDELESVLRLGRIITTERYQFMLDAAAVAQ